jgi:hypothetical protein
MLDIGLLKRGRGWAWPVNDSSGKTIMQGWESNARRPDIKLNALCVRKTLFELMT